MIYIRLLATLIIVTIFAVNLFTVEDWEFWVVSGLSGLIIHRILEVYRERGEEYERRWRSLADINENNKT